MNTEKLAKAEKIYLDSITKLELSENILRGAQGRLEAARKEKEDAHTKLLEVVNQITR